MMNRPGRIFLSNLNSDLLFKENVWKNLNSGLVE